MELWLRLAEVSGPARDVAVDAQGGHTVGQLIDELGLTRATRLGTARTGRTLDQETTLQAAGLRSGDVLTSRLRTLPQPRPGQWCLVIAGGPMTGQVVPLDDGLTIVGRGSAADIKVSDPELSRRHVRIQVAGDSVHVQDDDSTNGTFVYGQRVDEPVAVQQGVVVEAGDSALRFVRHRVDITPAPLQEGRLSFSRPPRVRPPQQPLVQRLPAPPEQPVKRRLSLASSLVPLAAAPVLAQASNSTAGYLVAALSPLMMVASYLEDRRSGRKDHAERVADFRTSVTAAARALAEDVRREADQAWADHPDAAELVSRATGPTSRLWERRAADADFLDLRVGWGDQPAGSSWTMPDGGDPAQRAYAEEQLGGHGVVHNKPVVVDLQTAPVLGLTGAEERVVELAQWLVVQAAVLHSPRDLVVVAAVRDAAGAAWEWIAWLPHARSEVAPFAAHPLAVGEDAARGLLAALNDLVEARSEQARSRLAAGEASNLPMILVVLDEQLEVPRTAVATLLESGPAAGVRVLWLGSRTSGLPGETAAIVEVTDAVITMTEVANGRAVVDAQTDRFSLAQAQDVALALAGIRDATARSRGGGEIPSFVSLPTLLGGDPSAETVRQAWQAHDGRLTAPVGVSETGSFSLDVRRDGPHALLGGTTGAGKSEMLQTLVASLAAHIPPSRLTFLLVDYKGGAAFKDCVKLPHVVGFVTDLDSHLVNRALVSLNAELHRRERVLGAAGAKDLIEMERRSPETAPASLLLVVDEFATLAKELPEFVEGVVNVAQRGRSLGIHMVLATQRPAGAINDNIRANTNLRMALRMNDEADSQDVIASKLAATLPRSLPGRAFVRTGASELTEVQIAYAGGHTLAGGEQMPLRVHPLRRGVVHRATAAKVVHDDRPSDLQHVVALVRRANEELSLPAQPAPWLPALPELLPLSELARTTGGGRAAVGLVDMPSRQAQLPYNVDLADSGSLLVVGSSGSGKSTLLRTLAVSLAEGAPADRLHLYGLDFASRGLGSLESLPHCGAVINGDDIERVQRLFRMIERWIPERKQLFGEAGCSDLEEHARIVGEAAALPRIVVLLDSYGGFSSTFEKIDYGARLDAFPQLVSEGRPLGIHFVVTADRPNVVPMALMSTVPARVVLRLADADDYGMLGLDVRVARQASLCPGRGFQQETLEVQVALVGTDPAGDAQAAAVSAVGARLAQAPQHGRPARVGVLPQEVDLAALLPASAPLRPVVGIGDQALAPVALDLHDGHVLVAGPNRSGKSTALGAIARSLRAADPSLELHLLAPRRSPLTSLDVWSSIARGGDAVDALSEEVLRRLKERQAEGDPIVLVIDDGHELVDSAADTALESIARLGRDVSAWVIGASETTAAQRSYGGWIQEVRKDRHGMLLQPDPDLDGDLLGARLPKIRQQREGRGVLVSRRGVEVVQVAT